MATPSSSTAGGVPASTTAPSAAAAATTTTTTVPDQKDVADVLEERLIDAEYKIWKKNTPYLYDFVMTHALEWPSLTCQWLPTVKNAPSPPGIKTNAMEHSLLLGTHTTDGEQNYLMVASVNLPKSDAVLVAPNNTNNHDGNSSAKQNNNAVNDEEEEEVPTKKRKKDPTPSSAMASPIITPTTVSANYDDERSELGGFGTSSGTNPGTIGKVVIRMKIKHEGEINRARYMPQNHFIVATRGPNPEVYIWDLTRHSSFPVEEKTAGVGAGVGSGSVVGNYGSSVSGSPFAPQGVCLGHTREGYGLCWSTHQEGRLISGGEDGTICLWDVSVVTSGSGGTTAATNAKPESGVQIHPLSIFASHTDVVEDVDYHKRDPNMIGSASDDRSIMLWDVREKNPNKPVHWIQKAHDNDVNCLKFNPVNEFLMASGSADKSVALWDMRNLKSRMQTLTAHNDQVYQIEWAPHNESILGSCSADRRVCIWDLSRIGMEQSPEDAEDGPPELLFMHGGHTSKVSDFSWNINDEWTIASVSEDNVLQIWNMADEIYANSDEDEADMNSDDDDEEDILGEE